MASRGPTYVEKGTTKRGPGHWVTNDECVIDRLRVKYCINVIKQDLGDPINPTMIWGRICRLLLVDKGKPLSGDKGTRTDKNSPKIRQGRMTGVWTNICAYEQDRSAYCACSKR